MAIETVTVHLCMSLQYPLGTNGLRDYSAQEVWRPEVWDFRVDDSDKRAYVGPQQVQIEVPDNFNAVPQQVAALEAEKAKAMDEYQRTVARINDKLPKLLAITHEA